MQEKIKWDQNGPAVKTAVVELIWHNKHGNATPTGKRIASLSWDKLSPAARRVLTNHGIIN